MQVQVTSVLGFIEHVPRFGQDRRGEFAFLGDRTVLREEIRLVPIFPGFQRLAVYLRGETDATALIEMKSHDEDAGTARKVGTVFPERPIGRLIRRSYANHVMYRVPHAEPRLPAS
jgi:hypothetical protein